MSGAQKKLAIAAGVVGLGLLTFTLCCAHGGDRATKVQEPSAKDAPGPTALGEAPQQAQPAGTAEPAAAKAAEPATPPAAAPAENPTARALRAVDEADRNLLADIERQTHENPPHTIRELLELRQSGATRSQLEQFIDQRLTGGGLAAQIAARRWLRAVYGEPVEPPVAPALGTGGTKKRVQPVTPAPNAKP